MGVDILDILSYSIESGRSVLSCSYLITLYYYINENCLPQVECKHQESRGCLVLRVFSFETGCHCIQLHLPGSFWIQSPEHKSIL